MTFCALTGSYSSSSPTQEDDRTCGGSNTPIEAGLALSYLSCSWEFHQVGNAFINMNIVPFALVVHEGTCTVPYDAGMTV